MDTKKIGTLFRADDIVLLTDNDNQLTEMLNICGKLRLRLLVLEQINTAKPLFIHLILNEQLRHLTNTVDSPLTYNFITKAYDLSFAQHKIFI